MDNRGMGQPSVPTHLFVVHCDPRCGADKCDKCDTEKLRGDVSVAGTLAAFWFRLGSTNFFRHNGPREVFRAEAQYFLWRYLGELVAIGTMCVGRPSLTNSGYVRARILHSDTTLYHTIILRVRRHPWRGPLATTIHKGLVSPSVPISS